MRLDATKYITYAQNLDTIFIHKSLHEDMKRFNITFVLDPSRDYIIKHIEDVNIDTIMLNLSIWKIRIEMTDPMIKYNKVYFEGEEKDLVMLKLAL